MNRHHTVSRRTFLGMSVASLTALTASTVMAESKKKKLVMLAGRPSHGPGEHEFNAGTLLLRKCLANVPELETSFYRNGWPDNEQAFDGANAIFIYADGGPGHPFIQDHRRRIIGNLMNRGVGLMCAHYAVEVPRDRGGKQFQDWIGGYYEDHWSCNPMWTPEYNHFPKHEITRGVEPFAVRGEWYFNIRFRPHMAGVHSILTAKPSDKVRNGPYVYPPGPYKHIQAAKGRSETMMWAVQRDDGGRGVGFTGGHYHHNWGNDNFRKVVLNALLWICKLPVPAEGVASVVTAADLRANLDPKQRK